MTTLKDSIFSVEECLQRAKVREAKREKHQSLESSTICALFDCIGLKFATWVGHHGRIPDSLNNTDIPP